MNDCRYTFDIKLKHESDVWTNCETIMPLPNALRADDCFNVKTIAFYKNGIEFIVMTHEIAYISNFNDKNSELPTE